jgi:hypothetical protein
MSFKPGFNPRAFSPRAFQTAVSGPAALMYAQSGVMRAGASRSNYHSAYTFVSIGGVQVGYGKASAAAKLQLPSLTIQDVLDERPNTCAFTILGVIPTTGQEVVITLGSQNNRDRRFAGHLLQVRQAQRGLQAPVSYHVSCIDYTWLLQNVTVTGRYTNQSATAIFADLIATYAPGFTAVVQADLDVIDEITFTNEDLPTALTRLMKRAGGYWKCGYLRDVHGWTGVEEGVTNPTTLTIDHPSVSDLFYETDLSQVITRMSVEGGGVNALGEVPVGETTLPVEDTVWYETLGGTVVAGPQRITYTGIDAGGAGTLVGPGIGPASGPTLTATVGAGIENGTHSYAVTFVTAAGESLPSPVITTSLVGAVTDPTTAPFGIVNVPNGVPGHGSFVPIGDTIDFAYAYSIAASSTATTARTLPSPASATIVTVTNGDAFNPTQSAPVRWNVPYSTDPRVKWIHLYMRAASNGAGFRTYTQTANNVSGGIWTADTEGGGIPSPTGTQPAVTNSAVTNQMALSSIAIGSVTVTARKVYRSAAGAAQLKLLATIADNTTTTYADSAADGTLGANVPISDTSGLTQPDGQINSGTTSIPVAGTGAFSASGGWVIIGNGAQVIRYTGISGSTLTGIPASGVGAIAASIAYNSTITTAPALTGIPATGTGSILYTIKRGDPVNLLATANNTAAQDALATVLGTGDGVVEEYLQDRRLSHTEAVARGQATLDLRSAAEESVRYHARDTNTRAGRTITVSIAGTTNLSGAFKIQQVTLSDFSASPTLFPTAQVSASTTRFSFEDLLRRVRQERP